MIPPRPIVLVAALTATASLSFAQEETPAAGETFAEIQAEFDSARKAWMDSYRQASRSGASKAEIDALRAKRPSAEPFVGRMTKVMDGAPGTKDGASAAIWLLRAARVRGEQFEKCLGVLEAHHRDSSQLGDVMLTLSRSTEPKASDFLDTVRAGSAPNEVRAIATFSLAEQLKVRSELLHTIQSADEASLARLAKRYGKVGVEDMRRVDRAAIEARSAACYEEVIGDADFAAVRRFGSSLGDQAKNALFELRNLSVGKVAPDIVGEDIDGTSMKLSDYRGKVVVLDFWGDW